MSARHHAMAGAEGTAAPRGWIVVVAAAVLARGLWMLFVTPEPIADYAFYYTRADELARGLGYRFQGHPTAFFPVGTSLILAGPFALFGASVALAKGLSLVAAAVAALLTFKLGELLAGPRTGVAAGLIVALHPDFIAFSSLVASENFFVPLLLGCLFALCLSRQPDRTRPGMGIGRGVGLACLAGLLFGAALLVRSTVLILLPVLVLLIAWDGRREPVRGVMCAAAFACAALLVLAPWVARNARVLGQPVLTTNGGVSLWWGNNPYASGGFPLSIEPPTQNLSTVQDELENNARHGALAFAFIKEHPVRWLSLAPAKFAFLFGPQASDIGFALRHRYVGGPGAIEYHPRLGDPRRAAEAAYVERPLSAAESRFIGAYYRIAGGFMSPVWQSGLWLAGSVGLTLLWWRRSAARGTLAIVIVVPLAWVLFHVTLGNGQPRYLLSVAPLLAIGAGDLVLTLAVAWRRARRTRGATIWPLP